MNLLWMRADIFLCKMLQSKIYMRVQQTNGIAMWFKGHNMDIRSTFPLQIHMCECVCVCVCVCVHMNAPACVHRFHSEYCIITVQGICTPQSLERYCRYYTILHASICVVKKHRQKASSVTVLRALTPVKVVPATRVIGLHDLRCLVGLQQSVNVMQFSPGQRVNQHLSCLLNVEVTCSQEPQYVCILGNLVKKTDTELKFCPALTV